MEAAGSYKTLIHIYQTTWRHIDDYRNQENIGIYGIQSDKWIRNSCTTTSIVGLPKTWNCLQHVARIKGHEMLTEFWCGGTLKCENLEDNINIRLYILNCLTLSFLSPNIFVSFSFYTRYEVLTAMSIKITVFWGVTLFSFVDTNLSKEPTASTSRVELQYFAH
jgi:hypothetical protein